MWDVGPRGLEVDTPDLNSLKQSTPEDGDAIKHSILWCVHYCSLFDHFRPTPKKNVFFGVFNISFGTFLMMNYRR